jgi:3-oxoacyl-[acyl-carrier protein] reductase
MGELRETEAACRKARPDCKVLTESLDLGKHELIDQLFEKLISTKLPIDILINNAGVFHRAQMSDLKIPDLQRVLQINLLAPLYLAHIVLPAMPPSGTIVNISSLSGCLDYQKFPGFGAYNISKYGLWGLTEILALENKDRGIRVNQLSLSGVDTQMFYEASPPGMKPQLSPEQVAEKILFLASADSHPMTGENIIFTEPDTSRDD